MRIARALLFAAIAAQLAAPAAQAAASHLLLPARGEALPPVLESVDREARRALAGAGVEVQSLEVTRRHLADLSGSGLACELSTDDCAVRIGLAADVDVVIVLTVDILDGRMVLRAKALETGDGAGARRVAGELSPPDRDRGQSVASVVLRAVGRQAAPTPVPVGVALAPPEAALVVDDSPTAVVDGRAWLVPGAHRATVTAPGYEELSTEVTVPGDGLGELRFQLERLRPDEERAPERALAGPDDPPAALPVGMVVAGVGAAVAVAAGISAGISEVILAGPLVPADRGNVEVAGRAGLVVAAVGTATALGGIVWLLAE
jgi:hypothetical protein